MTCSRYFHHRFQVLMQKILKSSLNPLGKIVDFFFRVEFQQRGSPHIHMLLWIENAPIYGETSTKEIETFIDRHCKCSKNEEISELINYQTHRHARTCKKMSVDSTFLCHQCQRPRYLNLLMTRNLKKMLMYSRIILRFLNI